MQDMLKENNAQVEQLTEIRQSLEAQVQEQSARRAQLEHDNSLNESTIIALQQKVKQQKQVND